MKLFDTPSLISISDAKRFCKHFRFNSSDDLLVSSLFVLFMDFKIDSKLLECTVVKAYLIYRVLYLGMGREIFCLDFYNSQDTRLTSQLYYNIHTYFN